MANPILVRVPADLVDLIPDYLEWRRRDLQALRAAFAVDDLETVQRIGHRIKGTGASYGFPPLTDWGRALEVAARTGQRDLIERSLAELTDYLERVEVAGETEPSE